MPIADDIKKFYPDDWEDIRERVLERSRLKWIDDVLCPSCESDDSLSIYSTVGNGTMDRVDQTCPCCEWCGRPNHVVSTPVEAGWLMHVYTTCMECGWTKSSDIRSEERGRSVWLPVGSVSRTVDHESSRCVLTIAHLDHDPRGPDLDRLRALCQRCHLTYDNQPEQRAMRRRIYAELRGQMTLLEDV